MAPPVKPAKVNTRLFEAIKRFRIDPSLFVKTWMQVTPDSQQTKIMQAVADGDRQVAVKSGHGVGKSTVLSWLAVWWITVFLDSKCRITAPTSTQLHDTLLAEMKSWISRMPQEMRDEMYHVTADRVEFKPFPTRNFISAVTSRADQPDAMHGVHAEHVLMIGDEASGIPDGVFEASVGSMSSGHACMVLAGNPVRNKGFFYDCFTKPGVAEKWTKFTVSCVGHPRISDAFIEEQKHRYGEDSNAYRIRVLGEFPKGDDDAVIPMFLIQSAVGREVEIVGNVVWGVDVATFGANATTLAKRKGNGLLEPVRRWKGLDPMQIVGAIQQEWEVTPFNNRPYEILVDALHNGLAVATRLRELKLPARAVNVSEAPAMAGRYVNLRSELWFKVREWFERRDCTIPRDEELIADLAMPAYRITPAGKVFVQGKATRMEDFKGMARSPDCFVAGTMVRVPGGRRPIESIREGDEVLTPTGVARVFRCWHKSTTELTTVHFGDTRLVGRPSHKVFTWAGFRPLDALSLDNAIELYSPVRRFAWKCLKWWSTAESGIGSKPHLAAITSPTTSGSSGCFTGRFGRTPTARFPMGTTSIIGTGILSIMPWKTWPVCQPQTTSDFINWRGWPILNFGPWLSTRSGRTTTWPFLGTHRPRVSSGTARTEKRPGKDASPCPQPVTNVAANSSPTSPREPDIARGSAPNGRTGGSGNTTRIGAFARSAARNLWRTVTGQRNAVVVSVQTENVPPTLVYDLWLEHDNVYYANDVLVANSGDALCMTFASNAATALMGGLARDEAPKRGIRGTV